MIADFGERWYNMTILLAGNAEWHSCHVRCCAHGIMTLFMLESGWMAINAMSVVLLMV